MKKWHVLKTFLWILPIISIISLLILTTQIVLAVIAVLVIVVVLLSYVHFEKLALEQRHAKLVELLKQEHLTALSHQRHDSMNDVQVLLGYIKLDKKDKSIEYVDKIKVRAQTESAIAKLNDYSLYHYISDLTLCNTKLTFELEVLSNTINWKEEYSALLIAILACYEAYDIANKAEEAELAILIVIDEQLHIQFEYNGQLTDAHAWRRDVEMVAKKKIDENRLILTIDEQDINITF